MNSYAFRSDQAELIDAPDVSFRDWEVCLRELDTINTWLGGHAITLSGLKKLLPAKGSELLIAEIGCGGGDNLKAIHRWNAGKQNKIRLLGIDINAACVDYARHNCADISDIKFIASDYKDVDFSGAEPDIIFSSLFCHHFRNNELVQMLKWMRKNARVGFFINDLQRHPMAFHSIKWLTRFFSKSYLVRNDAPISVMRGFRKEEWQTLFDEAGISNYSIEWKWAFRYLVAVRND